MQCSFGSSVSPGGVTSKLSSKLHRQKRSIVYSQYSDVWSKQLSVLVNAMNSLELVAKSTSGYLFPLPEIPDYMDSYWNDWIVWPLLNRDVIVLLNFKTDMVSRWGYISVPHDLCLESLSSVKLIEVLWEQCRDLSESLIGVRERLKSSE